jgi:hypothetical protein
MKTRALYFLLPAAAACGGLVLGALGRRTPERAGEKVAPHKMDGRQAEPAKDPAAEALALALSSRTLRDMARVGALLEQLDAAQLGAFLDALERNARLLDADLVGPVVAWWMQRDPAAVAAWLGPRMQRRFARPFLAGEPLAAIAAWAKAAPEDALRLAREHPEHGFSVRLLQSVLDAMPDAKPAARLELLRQFPPGNARREALEACVTRWMHEATPEAAREALGLAGTFPEGVERDSVLEIALPQLAKTQPMEALDLARHALLESAQAWKQLFGEAAKKDPAATAAWLDAAGGKLLETHAALIASAWVEKDVPTALDWAAGHGVLNLASFASYDAGYNDFFDLFGRAFGRTDNLTRPYYNVSSSAVLPKAFEKNREATMTWLRAQPAGPERDALVELAAGNMSSSPIVYSKRDKDGKPIEAPPPWQLAALAPMILEMPPESAANAVHSLVRNISPESPAATRRWAETLPAGPLRTQAWIAMGEVNYNQAEPPAGSDGDAWLVGAVKNEAWAFYDPASGQATLEKDEKNIAEKLGKIHDPELQRMAFDEVYFQAASRQNDPRINAFQESLERAAVPEAWKAPWREKLQEAAKGKGK